MTDDHEVFADMGPLIDEWASEGDSLEPYRPGWRRSVVVVVALLTVLALAAPPLYNLLDRGRPPIADNGLEVCGFDYCEIQDVVRSVGLDLEMSRLSNTILDDDGASELSEELTRYLGIDSLSVTIVDDLGGRLGGFYDPATRSIFIDRPASAWVVLHEVAHAVARGHGADFQHVLVGLARYMEQSKP